MVTRGDTDTPVESHSGFEINAFWRGIHFHIPLCCIIFFGDVWCDWLVRKRKRTPCKLGKTRRAQALACRIEMLLREEPDVADEYAESMTILTDNNGIILCPYCLARVVSSRCAAPGKSQ